MSDTLPKFEVEKVEGKVSVKKLLYVKTKNPDTGVISTRKEEKIVQEPFGYMVYTARGDALRVKNEVDLVRLGFGQPAEYVDMSTGEVVHQQPLSLKALANMRAVTTAIAQRHPTASASKG